MVDRYPCACSIPTCKCSAQVVIEGESCRYCRAGHTRSKPSGVQVRFNAHVNYSLTPEAAKRHGLERTGDGGTYIPSEKKLNEYLATERGHGREVHWRDH